jgi:hypothetical protein
VVLLRGAKGADCVRPLSGVIDELLAQVAPVGTDGERSRRNVLRLEQEIRRAVTESGPGALSALWATAAEQLVSRGKALPEDILSRARTALKMDGDVLDCNEALPARLLRHAWNWVQEGKSERFHALVDRLLFKLNEILRAEFAGSASGRRPEQLKATVGAAHADVFDFEAMSRILSRVPHHAALSEARRNRIRALISVLGSQRFFPAKREAGEGGAGQPCNFAHRLAYTFVFESCATALKAVRERMPRLVEVARAIAIAELEVDGSYSESRHDALFEGYGDNGLDAEDLALFPSYLVCLRAPSAGETSRLAELLSANLPVKVLLQTDDLLEESAIGSGHLSIGVRAKQLADAAIGLNQVFVLQSSASNLVRSRGKILRGLSYPGPALFNVYSGEAGRAPGVPAYLAAAAAMEARVFPAFTYDPSAGGDWASRFCIDDNPQPERDWPAQAFSYEDEEHQNICEEIDFTVADFISFDPRAARHFARVPRERWNGSMVPVREAMGRSERLPDKVPYVLMVDERDVLQKVVADDRVIQEVRRIGGLWRSLQELGGVRNSHAERLLAREREAWAEKQKAWEEQVRREAEARGRQEAKSLAGPALAPAAAALVPTSTSTDTEAEPVEDVPSDDPWIETPRCTTCEECVRLNNRMFVYNGNKQAYIADVNAGTYRELVEAAESCQVAIIHPGKPRNPNEPGLEELIKRAEPFLRA